MQYQDHNQESNYNSQFSLNTDGPVTNSNEINGSDNKGKSKRKRILAAILSFLIFAVPLGISRGLQEYNREQQRQQQQQQLKSIISNIDTDKLNDILNSDTEEESDISGTQTEDIYENNFFGIGCKLSGWTFLSEEELSELSEQAITDESEKDDCFFAFKAENNESTANVNMLISKNTLGENPDEKQGLELMAEQAKNSPGVKYCECVNDNICGENKYILKTVFENGNTELYTYQFMYLRKTKYAVITIVALTDDEAKDIYRQFYKI